MTSGKRRGTGALDSLQGGGGEARLHTQIGRVLGGKREGGTLLPGPRVIVGEEERKEKRFFAVAAFTWGRGAEDPGGKRRSSSWFVNLKEKGRRNVTIPEAILRSRTGVNEWERVSFL